MHVARGEEAIIGRDGRAERDFVGGVPDLRERLDRAVTRLASEPVLAGYDEDPPRGASVDENMRQHGEAEPRRAPELDRVRIARLNAEMLCEHRRQHEV